MPLFQKTVVEKQLKSQDQKKIDEKWEIYKKYFLNPEVQANIKKAKEEQYQEGFLRDLFVKVLGYTLNPDVGFNLTTELKNVKDSKKADGGILKFEPKKEEPTVVGVIELKGTDTTDLNKVEEQAFGYKNNQEGCRYVIISNFEKLRFYIDNAIDYEEFNLFELSRAQFSLLYLCLEYDNLITDVPLKTKEESLSEEDAITKKLYKDYSVFKNALFADMQERNPQYDALTLFKKSQKLLDRFLFLFFAEDRNLLPPNSVREILKQWTQLKELDAYTPLYNRFKKYFGYLNTGHKGKQYDIFAYNGGLFQPDEVLDHIEIDDDVLYANTLKLSEYDFDSEVDVNILGHIFENSLNEIEEVQAQLEAEKDPNPDPSPKEKGVSKRKKDGVFYTPKYITHYIVENTVGKLCQEKKDELDISDEAYEPTTKRSKLKLDRLQEYRDWLLQLTICDPACGSGAFLNEALNFLIDEHQYIDELSAKYNGDALVLSDVENSILENNIFGVDINEESVEIAKLSLWLRTAQPNRKLNDLSGNIKCGNSLIDDPEMAGDKAFDWQKEFPKVFAKGGFDVVIGNPPYVQLQKMKEASEELKQIDYKTYESTGDLYCLFYEKGNIILREKGLLGYVTSNQWMRANYGKSLREYFNTYTQPYLLIDLGNDIFESATVDSNILCFKKETRTKNPFLSYDLSSETAFQDFTVYDEKATEINPEGDEIWIIESPIERNIKKKIEEKGTTLKEWDIENFRGVLTGYNDAFIIDKETKERLINEDPKSEEIIKPILRGRDIQRYFVDFADLYLIATFPALNLNINDFPAVKNYLESFGEKLNQTGKTYSDENGISQKTRKKTNNKWFETQDAIAYYKEFKKDYIIWKRIGSILRFAKVRDIIALDSNCILTGQSLDYLLAIFNSKMGHYLMKDAPKTGTGDLIISVQAIEPLRIPILTNEAQQPFIDKADQMMELSKDFQEITEKFQRSLQRKFPEQLEKLPKKLESWYALSYAEFIQELKKKKVTLSLSDEAEWEDYFLEQQQKALALKNEIDHTDKEIDAMVYELYGLTEEEVNVVEGS